MPLFGFRKDKKHEQSHVQAEAGLTKNASSERKAQGRAKQSRAFKASSPKPEKVSRQVVTKDAGAAKASPALPTGSFGGSAHVILRPRVTEKSGMLAQGGVYTFEVARDANKRAISEAVRALYKVTPVKVAMTNLPAKSVFVKGRRGTVAGIRKALVTLKKGDKIDFL